MQSAFGSMEGRRKGVEAGGQNPRKGVEAGGQRLLAGKGIGQNAFWPNTKSHRLGQFQPAAALEGNNSTLCREEAAMQSAFGPIKGRRKGVEASRQHLLAGKGIGQNAFWPNAKSHRLGQFQPAAALEGNNSTLCRGKAAMQSAFGPIKGRRKGVEASGRAFARRKGNRTERVSSQARNHGLGQRQPGVFDGTYLGKETSAQGVFSPIQNAVGLGANRQQFLIISCFGRNGIPTASCPAGHISAQCPAYGQAWRVASIADDLCALHD